MTKKKVVLYAQPDDEFPYLKKKALKDKEYEETDGLFGTIPFTDVGEEAWRAIKSTDKDASLKLVKAKFRGVPWTVLFYSDNLRAAVTCQKYTSGVPPENLLVELKVEGEEKVLKKFVRRIVRRMEVKPWKMTDWDDFSEFTGKEMKEVISNWKRYSEKEKPAGKKKKKMPEKVVTETDVEYKQDKIVLWVEVENLKSGSIRDIRVNLRADEEMLEAESWEQGVPRLNSTGKYKAMFNLKPKDILEEESVRPILRYNDGKRKKRKLKPVKVTVTPPEIEGLPVDDDEIVGLKNRFDKKEERGKFLKRPADELFNDLVDDLGDSPLFMLEPDVDRRSGTYTGKVDLCGKDEDGVKYILGIEVQGGSRDSRVTRTLYSSDEECIVGFKQFVETLGVFEGLFEEE